MAQYINKSDVVIAIDKLMSKGKLKCQQSQENNDQISYIAWSELIATCEKMLSFINTLEVKEVFSENGNRPPVVTVKEAIERKIINSQFALKGAYSGKMYFYSWKKSINKMPENIANLKLSTNYKFDKGELGSYNIEPMVRLVESSFSHRPYLET